MTKYTDGRSCSICGYYKTIYHEWDCCGTWTSESECTLGYDLEEAEEKYGDYDGMWWDLE